MIAFNFNYYKPDTVEEALSIFNKLNSLGKRVIYYGGGTEIITFGRRGDIKFDAVIDIKGIKECRTFGVRGEEFTVGAAVTLTKASESKIFPLFSETSRFAADHTARSKITLGGNICGKIIYKEAILSLLAAGGTAVIAGNNGCRHIPVIEIFDKTLKLNEGEFLVQVKLSMESSTLPHIAIRKTKISRVDYPIVSAGALLKDGKINIAISGALPYPFRSLAVEEALNERGLALEKRAENAIENFPDRIIGGVTASAEYRTFVIRNTFIDIMSYLEVSHG